MYRYVLFSLYPFLFIILLILFQLFILSLLSLYYWLTGFNTWKDGIWKIVKQGPTNGKPKEKAICFTEGAKQHLIQLLRTNYFISHIVNTSGMLPGYGRWENQKCYDEKAILFQKLIGTKTKLARNSIASKFKERI